MIILLYFYLFHIHIYFTLEKQNKAPTRGEIEEHKQRTLQRLLDEKQKEEEEKDIVHQEEIDPDKEFINPNFQNDNLVAKGVDVIDATGLEDALQGLDLIDIDKHPEKRMRAAWNSYLEKQMPLFKLEYPKVKRQQLIQMIQKEFKKSPENPIYKQQLAMAKKADV